MTAYSPSAGSVAVQTALAVGVLPYPVTFLCTDFISELYGRARASFVVWVGLGLNCWVLLFLWLGGVLPPVPALDPATGLPPTDHYAFAFYRIRLLTTGAVVASMVFVGLEIRQNTMVARAAAYQEIGFHISERYAAIQHDPAVVQLFLMAGDPTRQQEITEVVAHLEASGVAIECGPIERSGAEGPMTSVYCRDPDQNLIEIATYGRA